MMNMLKKRLNKKGFTLAELLIVVAIIAVLVAVSIPIFTSRLEKSREATDVANMRAAKAEAVAAYLDETSSLEVGSSIAATKPSTDLFYDAENGTLKKTVADINGYGKGTTNNEETKYSTYNAAGNYTNGIIKITVTNADGSITLSWVDKNGNPVGTVPAGS